MKMIDIDKIRQKINSLSVKQKRLFTAITVFLVVDLIIAGVLLATKNYSAVHLECYGKSDLSSLVALDSCSQSGVIRHSEYANFKFTHKQKELFTQIYDDKGTVALTVRLQLKPTKKQKFMLENDTKVAFKYGFLGKDDFSSKGKFIKQNYSSNKRIVVQGNEKDSPSTFDISFAVQKNDDIAKVIPEGFFVYSDIRCKIVAACVVPAEIGFELNTEIPFYGFSCNGGVVDFSCSGFDFSGASMIFPVQNSVKSSMPEFVIGLSDNAEMKTSVERSVKAEINLGGEKIFINNVPSARDVVIPSAAMKAPFSRLELLDNRECVSSIILRSTFIAQKDAVNALYAVRTDPGLILQYKSSSWRCLDYEVFEWDRYPGILFFDTRNYEIQDNFFRRMAYFVEKSGYKGRLVSNEELEGKHGYNAHDYSAESMALFFNKASETGFVLNKEENLLKQILIANGLFELEQNGITVKAKQGGIVSISQESPDYLRTTLLAHEGWHTLFFRDEEFRNYVSAVYYTIDPLCLDFLLDFFKSQPGLGYDLNDQYLMHNEFMAYIMQQRLSDVAGYFVHLANRGSVMKFTPDLAAYIRKNEGKGFEDAAFALNDYVFDKYGITCGNIALVTKR